MLERQMIPALRFTNNYSIRGSRYTYMFFDKNAVKTVKDLAKKASALGTKAEFIMVPENYASVYHMDLD